MLLAGRPRLDDARASRSPPPWDTARCRSAASRASRSSPPATSWCCRASTPGPDQIVASSLLGLAGAGGRRRRARRSISASPATRSNRSNDRIQRRAARCRHPRDARRRLGRRHDLVQEALQPTGHGARFLARRPASGQAADARPARATHALLGLPGNPVSSIVCAILFLVPAIRALQGHADAGAIRRRPAILGARSPANGDRQDYMRATLSAGDAAGRDCSRGAGFAPCSAFWRGPMRCSCGRPTRLAQKAGESCRIIRPRLLLGLQRNSPKIKRWTCGTQQEQATLFCFVSEIAPRDGAVKASHADAKAARTAPFIHERLRRSGVPPSFDEMKDALDLKSKSGIHRLITALEERGFIRRLPNRARALEVIACPRPSVEPPDSNASRRASSKGGSPARHGPRRRRPTSARRDMSIPVMGRIAAGYADLGDPEPQPFHHPLARFPPQGEHLRARSARQLDGRGGHPRGRSRRHPPSRTTPIRATSSWR